MPALDFPSSPTNGQVYGQYVYDSTKGAWRVSADLLASATPSHTAPTNPVSGDLWFNTNDGVMFMYFNDGNTSQWVEVKSNTASGSTVAARVDAIEAKPAGLVQITPTSVTVSSGTASVSNGAVSYSGVGSVSLDGIFTSEYTSYRIIVAGFQSVQNPALYRFRTASGDISGGLYYFQEVYSSNTTIGASGFVNQATGRHGYYVANTWSSIAMDVINPTVNAVTEIVNMQGRSAPTSVQNVGGYNDGTIFSGMTFIGNGGNITGKIQVYGYR